MKRLNLSQQSVPGKERRSLVLISNKFLLIPSPHSGPSKCIRLKLASTRFENTINNMLQVEQTDRHYIDESENTRNKTE